MHHGSRQWAYDIAARILSGYGFAEGLASELEKRIVEVLIEVYDEQREAIDFDADE
jgi:hypothetical protein